MSTPRTRTSTRTRLVAGGIVAAMAFAGVACEGEVEPAEELEEGVNVEGGED